MCNTPLSFDAQRRLRACAPPARARGRRQQLLLSPSWRLGALAAMELKRRKQLEQAEAKAPASGRRFGDGGGLGSGFGVWVGSGGLGWGDGGG